MERTLKSLVLIRAKHLAESVTTPSFLADNEGNLIFYNEAAEVLLGRAYADAGPMPASEWAEIFDVRYRDGAPENPPALAASGTTIELTAAAAAPI